MNWAARGVLAAGTMLGVFLASACLLPSFDDVRPQVTDDGGDEGGDGGLVGCDDPTALVIWPMTEGSGTTINDCSGNFPGTISGNVQWTTGRNGQPALDLQGGWVNIVSAPALAITGPFTIAAWFAASNTQIDTFGDLFSRYDSMNAAVFDLTVTKDPQVALTLFGSPLTQLAGAIAYDIFTHVAATYQPGSGQAVLYINGVIANQGVGPTALGAVTVPMVIGANHAGSSVYRGKIAGLRVYDRILTGSEIAALVQ